MKLQERFTAYILKEDLFRPKDRLLIAVSGGIDSVVLCELCKQSGYAFAIAHCNFKLRGADSNLDEAFVQSVAQAYAVPFFVKQFDTIAYAEKNKLSIQVAARTLRYEWFHQLADGNHTGGYNETGDNSLRLVCFDYILTAHHADDNVETILMNFFKGTGIAGLRGILPKQGKLIRPLLFCHKDELHAFAETHQLSYREDASNSTDKYTRNYFRNQLIPSLEKLFPAVSVNLAENSKRFAEIENLYYQAIRLHKKKLIEYKGKEVHIPVLKLKKTEPFETVIYEVIREFGFSSRQVTDVISLLDSESGKFIASANFRIIRNRKWLIIAPSPSPESGLFIVGEDTRSISFPAGKLDFKVVVADDQPLTSGNDMAMLDAAELSFPLILRRWKQGDYFYPLGMKKKKKLSRFFIDNKLSLTEKEQAWVLEMNKKIIWVIGRRIDDRFKLTPSSKSILQVKLTPND